MVPVRLPGAASRAEPSSPEVTGRALTPAVYCLPYGRSAAVTSTEPLRLLNETPPPIRVEILVTAVGADERAEPGTRPAILVHAFERVLAVVAVELRAAQIAVGLETRGGESKPAGLSGCVRSRHLLDVSLPTL